MAAEGDAPRSRFEKPFWCCFWAGGIVGSLVVYGILQERIMSEPFGGEMFRTSALLIFFNRIVAVLYAACMLWAKGETVRPQVPVWKYCAVSCSNVAATWCQYEAL